MQSLFKHHVKLENLCLNYEYLVIPYKYMKFIVINNLKVCIVTVRINELDWFSFLYFKTKLKENHMRFLIGFFTKLYIYIGYFNFIQNFY